LVRPANYDGRVTDRGFVLFAAMKARRRDCKNKIKDADSADSVATKG
jgi:hypothetical protein